MYFYLTIIKAILRQQAQDRQQRVRLLDKRHWHHHCKPTGKPNENTRVKEAFCLSKMPINNQTGDILVPGIQFFGRHHEERRISEQEGAREGRYGLARSL